MNALVLAASKSAALHVLLGILLVSSMHFLPAPQPKDVALSVPVIQAVSVDKKALEQQLQKIQEEKDRIKRAEEKKIRDAEEKKRKAKETARKKREEEKARKKKLEEDKKKKEIEKKKAEEKKKKEAEEAKKKKEAEKKAQEEAEIKRKAAEEKAEQERLIQEQLQAEQMVRNQQRRRQVMSEVDKYSALITQTIQSRWITDDFMKGKPCRLTIKFASNGLILDVQILEGDDIVCRSAKAAALKTETVPMTSDPEVYKELKEINFTFIKE